VCRKKVTNKSEIVWHCPNKKNHYQHRNGYDLCQACGKKQLHFSELNGLTSIERDERYPIRVTLQYYKSTDNGVVNLEIMTAIKNMLSKSQQEADFVGSLVVDGNNNRPTEPDLSGKNSNNYSYVNVNPSAGYDQIRAALSEFCGKDWQTFYSNFVEQQVNDEDVLNLEDADFVELIPKMGPRSRFKKWVKQRK
jgi:hypothetical protein